MESISCPSREGSYPSRKYPIAIPLQRTALCMFFRSTDSNAVRFAVQGLTLPWFVILLASFAATLGCSSDTAQVSGKVVYKDGTVPKGGVCVVQFLPTDDSPAKIRKPATGEIREDGSFEACTRKPGDGVFLGKYDVTFAVWEGALEPVSLVEKKYTKKSTTPYHVTIDDDVSNLVFEIEPAPTGKR
jgi:hypothetical protein